MGLMEPEELSFCGVETDKGAVINTLVFPERSVQQTDQDGHLTEFNHSEEDTDTLALTIVSNILDESIEIFNKVDEANLLNNNSGSRPLDESSISNQNSTLSNKCDLTEKTDCLEEGSYNIDPYNQVNGDSTRIDSVDNSVSLPFPILDGQNICKDSSDGDSCDMLKCVSADLSAINSSIDADANHSNFSSSDVESISGPLISDSDSSVSQSNENIPIIYSNVINNETAMLNNLLLNNDRRGFLLDQDKEQSCNNIILSSHSNDIEASLDTFETIENSEDSGLNQTNGLSDFLSGNYESNSDIFSIYSEPATLPVSDFLCQHDCLHHPDVQQLRREHGDMTSAIQVYKEKADRLDECLLDLDKMIDKVGILEKKICQQEMEVELSKQEKEIESRTFSAFRQETNTKMESLKKKYDQANKEKEGMVMRYAKSEKELLDMKKEKTTLLKQIKDQKKENENVLSKLRSISEDKSRLAVSLDNKNMELSVAHKEADKLKEEINTRDIKIKWIQNKLIGEMDLHKDCPDKIEHLSGLASELEKKLEKSQEEIEQYKKTIQELEAIKVLEGQVREEQAKLILERHDQSERVIKMKALQLKTDALIEENNSLSTQVQNLEVERFDLDKRLSESRREAQECANKLADLRSKLVEFDSISNQLTQERDRLEKTNEEVERLRKANEELIQDMSTCRSREAEMLSFTQKLTTKNVQLQSEFSSIESRAGELMLEAEKAESVSDTLKRDVKNLKEELETERCKREEERNLLAREVAEGRTKVASLESQLSDTKSDLHSSTNKHQALIRELQRELQVCHRRLDQEGKSLQTGSHMGPSSQHSSSPNQSGFTGHSSPGASSSLTSSLNSIPDATIVQPSHPLEVSPTVLVERILRLQTDSKNYQDKIEFLEDHNTTLVEELKKKGRLLHSYIMREQAGALSTQASDNHKLEVSKHGGIMASVYGSKPTDDGMTLELSLQINHKLQAILEDTLLKNITLKENIDTLGDEIERLKKIHPS